MSLLLHIESSGTNCSVALSEDERLISCKELNDGYSHAENLHLFIDTVLQEAACKPGDLAAVAVSKGPGSYTGLRIGVSAAKGLAFALSIPLISIETLELMCRAVPAERFDDSFILCPMLDARRMEVYTARYSAKFERTSPIEALIMDETVRDSYRAHSKLLFFGEGMPKCRPLLSHLPGAEFIENIFPSARFMCLAAFEKFRKKQFEDRAYFEPFYLKEFMVKTKSN